jgi:ATP-dependent RNA helicase RhlE
LTDTTFGALGLAEPILRALAAQNFTTPSPIQAGAIPHLLEGHDLLGIAQTGTGKTASFSLPMIQHLMTNRRRAHPFHTRALILAPTRELAIQIDTAIKGFAAGMRSACAAGPTSSSARLAASATS